MVATRLSKSELADMDRRRGFLDRGAYLRWLILRAAKEGVDFSAPVTDADRSAALTDEI